MPTAIVVEDDPFWMAETTAALREAGVEVLPARGGEEALGLVRAFPRAVLVLDMILPDTDGVEILRQARAISPNLKVLAMTGGGRLGPDFHLRLARAFGAVETVAKPFTAERFLAHWRRAAA